MSNISLKLQYKSYFKRAVLSKDDLTWDNFLAIIQKSFVFPDKKNIKVTYKVVDLILVNERMLKAMR